MSTQGRTASQTVGPFFHDCLVRLDARRSALATPDTEGVHIRIKGHVYDGDGAAVPDAMVEIWQANHWGRYNIPPINVRCRSIPISRALGAVKQTRGASTVSTPLSPAASRSMTCSSRHRIFVLLCLRVGC